MSPHPSGRKLSGSAFLKKIMYTHDFNAGKLWSEDLEMQHGKTIANSVFKDQLTVVKGELDPVFLKVQVVPRLLAYVFSKLHKVYL